MKTTFNQGDVVRFKDGLYQDFVLVTQAQFDVARHHYNDLSLQIGERTVLIQEGEYKAVHPGDLMYVAACRSNSQLMLILGETRAEDGRFAVAFIGAGMLDIVQ